MLAASLLLLFPTTALFLLGGCCGLLFFHLFADLFLALAADLRPLGALGLDHFLAAQQLDENRVGPITGAPSLVDDAQIAAAAIAKARRHGVEQPFHRFPREQVTARQAPRGHVPALAQRDHLFHVRAHRLGLGLRGLNPLFHNE